MPWKESILASRPRAYAACLLAAMLLSGAVLLFLSKAIEFAPAHHLQLPMWIGFVLLWTYIPAYLTGVKDSNAVIAVAFGFLAVQIFVIGLIAYEIYRLRLRWSRRGQAR